MSISGQFCWGKSNSLHSLWQMQESEKIQCPFCGQTFALEVDTTQAEQVFTVDCEICCRPMEVSVHCEDGEVLDLDVRGD
jgi:transcription elongation factor Elf1